MLALLILGGCQPGADVAATIDGRQITIKELRSYLQSYRNNDFPNHAGTPLEELAAPLPSTDLEAALGQLINEYLLRLAARQRGWLSEDEKDLQKCRRAEERVLEELGRQVPWPSLQEAKEYYQQHPKKFKTETRYELEHLLFSSEHSAWEVREKIVAGRLTLAEAGRQAIGGAHPADCGRKHFVTARELPPELGKALTRLQPGQLSQVIASPYGYHLLRIVQRRPAGRIPFAEVENRIKDTIFAKRLRENYRNWLKQQRQEHNIRTFPKHLEKAL